MHSDEDDNGVQRGPVQEDPPVRREQDHGREDCRPHVQQARAHEDGTEDGPGHASDENAEA